MIGILLLTAAAQAADSSLPIMRAQVRAPLAGYFSRDDYPASARARREEGEVAVQLTIGNDGRVIGCAVLATTASSTLANTTCRILRSRSRFTPAHDATGRPVTDAGLAVIRWSLAEGPRTVQ